MYRAAHHASGFHHNGLGRRYRAAVEMLFRMGFLRIVFSTETLSLGVNMPCKATVFLGDSVLLTPLLYRQVRFLSSTPSLSFALSLYVADNVTSFRRRVELVVVGLTSWATLCFGQCRFPSCVG